jgi:hypothetical protein
METTTTTTTIKNNTMRDSSRHRYQYLYMLLLIVGVIQFGSTFAGKLRAAATSKRTTTGRGSEIRRGLLQQQHHHHHHHHRSLLAPNNGKVTILVLLVRFADHEDRNVAPREYWDDLCNTEIRNYFLEQSYGVYDITCLVQDWVTVPATEAQAAGSNSGKFDTLKSSEFFLPALDALAENDSNIFSKLDSNEDGFLDNVVVIH